MEIEKTNRMNTLFEFYATLLTDKVLESYEEKLHLFSNYVVRNQLLEELMTKYSTDQYLISKLQEIQQIDEEEF